MTDGPLGGADPAAMTRDRARVGPVEGRWAACRRSVRAWPGLARTSVAAVALAGTCVGWALVPWTLGVLVARALDAVDPTGAPRRPTLGAGALAMTLVGPAVGLGGAGAVLLGSAHAGLAAACALVAPAAVFASLGPLLVAPFARADGAPGAFEGCAAACVASARRASASVAFDGALAGLLAGLPAALLALQPVSGSLVVWAGLGVWALVLVPAGAVVLARGLRTVEVPSAPPGDQASLAMRPSAEAPSASAVPGLRAVLFGSALGGFVLAVACVAALAVPAPATPLGQDEVPLEDELAPRGDGGFAVPGPHGLVVSRAGRTLRIEAADGGGAGEVALASEGGALRVGRGRFAGVEAWEARLEAPPSRVVFDAEGVRLDDGPAARFPARVGAVTLASTGVALALLSGFLAAAVGRLRAAAPDGVRRAASSRSPAAAPGTAAGVATALGIALGLLAAAATLVVGL